VVVVAGCVVVVLDVDVLVDVLVEVVVDVLGLCVGVVVVGAGVVVVGRRNCATGKDRSSAGAESMNTGECVDGRGRSQTSVRMPEDGLQISAHHVREVSDVRC